MNLALKRYTPIILLSCAIALTACAPAYRTNYNLLPPVSQSGQICTSAVKSMSDVCVQNCQQMARSCRSFGPGGSSLSYGFSNTRGGLEPSHGSSILDDRDCNATQCTESCLTGARKAHLTCGGTITEQTVCTANCPPPASPKP